MNSKIVIRPESGADVRAISEVTVSAFRTLEISNHTEQFIIAALRAAGALTVSLVAEMDGRVVGHIAFSPVLISDGTRDWYGLGPVSVLPEFQGRGADSYLIVEGCKVIQGLTIRNGEYWLGDTIYDDYEMQWIGEFNPKMVNVAEGIAENRSRILSTYRYLFDRTKEFKRHPILH